MTFNGCDALFMLQVRTLNYAPGPMDTDMQVAIRESSTLPPTVRDMFKKMHTEVRPTYCVSCAIIQ